ncbi:hypothetical protein ONZ45_g12491 [Pleurotus djamor]|nr:hypothetical protein ONZ45_g12491 [Pleurotus djamor]
MLGRITRSGAVFSPWGVTAETRYELVLDLATLLDRIVDRDDETDNLSDGPDSVAVDDGVCAGQEEVLVGEDASPAQGAEDAGCLVSQVEETSTGTRSVANDIPKSNDQSTPIVPSQRTPSSGLTGSEKRKNRSKLQKKEKRRENRFKYDAENSKSVRTISMRRAQETKRVALSYSASQARHSGSGYVGHKDKKGTVLREKERVGVEGLRNKSLQDLLDEGFELIEWDGKESLCMVDSFDRIVVCGGTPRDESWPAVANGCAEVIELARSKRNFPADALEHRRGPFPALAAGFSFGNGMKRPANLTDRSAANVTAMRQVVSDTNIKRVAGFQSCLLGSYLPNLSSYYRDTMTGLQASQPKLKMNFKNSQFSSITVNFGPQTVSVPHLDFANLSTGMCAITALGQFDPDVGGHLVLWELRIILRFPPGSTVLIPSALIHHSNLPIQSTETRYSVTQYSAGGLFRWVENGYCCDKDCVIDKSQRPSPWDEGIERLRWGRQG